MALIPFKSTEKKGIAKAKSIISLALFLAGIVGWMCIF
tara:strand:- start:1116 stop:1229 length:114 start_codon:yes stop_codon:yes gene_type:complete